MPKCPACGGRGLVIDTRPVEAGTRRRLRCPQCLHRWSTLEIYVADYEMLLRARSDLLKLRAIAAKATPEKPKANKRKSPQGYVKLSSEAVADIRRLYPLVGVTELARRYGASVPNIYSVLSGRTHAR